jgi:sec-independent protein translocase protein TatC
MRDNEKLPLTEHLEELRTRLIRCCIAIAVGTCVSYAFKEKIFELLSQPLLHAMREGDKLIFTGITEAFFTYIKISLLSGILIAIPVILYEFWMFTAPGLYQHEKKIILPIVIISTFFFIGGALFAYFIVFPYGFKFLLEFASENVQAMPSMKEYLSFSAKFLLAFGLIFEMPIVITLLAWMGMVTTDFLKKNRKYAVILIWVVAAILTPTPDIVTQAMMAVPLMLLYEISIIGARIFGRSSRENSSPKPEEQK